MLRSLFLVLVSFGIIGCGIVQIGPVLAPKEAPREVRRHWNPAERGRQELLKRKSVRAGLDTCTQYLHVQKLNPDFGIFTLTGKVTVADRVKETCKLTVEEIGRCRAQRHEDQCPDVATTVSLVEAVEGRWIDPTRLPQWLPETLNADLGLWITGRYYLEEAHEVLARHAAGGIDACASVAQLHRLARKAPPEVQRQYSLAMASSKQQATHDREVNNLEAKRSWAAGRVARSNQQPTNTMVFTDVHRRVAASAGYSSSALGNFLALLDVERQLRDSLYDQGSNLLVAVLQRTRAVSPEELRNAVPIVRCAGDYRPNVPNSLNALQLTDEMEKAAALLEDHYQRLAVSGAKQAEEEERCQADPNCVKQREIDSIAGELCPLLVEIGEIKARLKARLKEAQRYGVINKADQYEDMEDKQFCEERAADLKRDYREVAGKKFTRKVCKSW